ncbi:Aspartate--tRNA(Asp/Asn) ligase [Dirofilaria immitis]
MERVSFTYIWTTKVLIRQLNENESVILRVSPKFATVHGQIAFQWSLQMRGVTYLNDKEQREETDDDSEDEVECEPNYIALSLYFNDGPAPVIDDLQTITKLLHDKKNSIDSDDSCIVSETKRLSAVRGKETELTTVQRFYFSNYIMKNIYQVIRLAITLNFPLSLFDPTTYLNTLTPTPITSFLTANYRARASSKVFSRRKNKLLSEMEDSLRRRLSLKQHDDFEEIFNRIMDEKNELCDKPHLTVDLKKCEGLKDEPGYKTILFKKLLMACCDGCQKRAKIMEEENLEMDQEEIDEVDNENAFECNEQSKDTIHEMLANMFFTKVVLPEMDYVENFADFLIDVELNNLPVLKRVCEGYLCSELNSKKDLITSLLLELLYLAIVFNLRVLKSITLSELSNRPEELDEPDALLVLDEYKNLDCRMIKLSGSNLVEVIEEVQRFREQRLRTKLVKIN